MSDMSEWRFIAGFTLPVSAAFLFLLGKNSDTVTPAIVLTVIGVVLLSISKKRSD